MLAIYATLRWILALWQHRIGCFLRQGVHWPLLLAFCMRLFQSSDGAPLLAHTDSLPGPVHVGDSVFFADEECRW